MCASCTVCLFARESKWVLPRESNNSRVRSGLQSHIGMQTQCSHPHPWVSENWQRIPCALAQDDHFLLPNLEFGKVWEEISWRIRFQKKGKENPRCGGFACHSEVNSLVFVNKSVHLSPVVLHLIDHNQRDQGVVLTELMMLTISKFDCMYMIVRFKPIALYFGWS